MAVNIDPTEGDSGDKFDKLPIRDLQAILQDPEHPDYEHAAASMKKLSDVIQKGAADVVKPISESLKASLNDMASTVMGNRGLLVSPPELDLRPQAQRSVQFENALRVVAELPEGTSLADVKEALETTQQVTHDHLEGLRGEAKRAADASEGSAQSAKASGEVAQQSERRARRSEIAAWIAVGVALVTLIATYCAEWAPWVTQ